MASTNVPESTDDLAELRDMAESLQEKVSFRQGAVVAAAHALANHQRVHAAVTRAAETFPEFKSTLSYMCPSWRDPDATDADELLDLLNLAPSLRCEATQDADALVRRCFLLCHHAGAQEDPQP